ncbi:MAG: ABC transporter ATP-binding protein [Planctomycetes bacterium]|nr:ABC transporter ATP-binding protein [Planctomycetota bacterium]
MNAVQLVDVRVRLGATTIGPFALDVREREHVLIVGPSGSGKTTVLRAIAGLAPLASGTLDLFGERATEGPRQRIAPERRRIGFLFQGGALWPHMSARKQIGFVLAHAGCPSDQREQRTLELLEWVELPGFAERMPATLSGGEAQRLALARALAVEPKLLLLDEPLGPLDFELRDALLAKLGELQQRLGLTVVHVTHAPNEARAIASRIVRIRAGRIEGEERT